MMMTSAWTLIAASMVISWKPTRKCDPACFFKSIEESGKEIEYEVLFARWNSIFWGWGWTIPWEPHLDSLVLFKAQQKIHLVQLLPSFAAQGLYWFPFGKTWCVFFVLLLFISILLYCVAKLQFYWLSGSFADQPLIVKLTVLKERIQARRQWLDEKVKKRNHNVLVEHHHWMNTHNIGWILATIIILNMLFVWTYFEIF